MGTVCGAVCGIVVGSWVGSDDADGLGMLAPSASMGLGGGGVWRGLLRLRGTSVLLLMTGPDDDCLSFPSWWFAVQLMVC